MGQTTAEGGPTYAPVRLSARPRRWGQRTCHSAVRGLLDRMGYDCLWSAETQHDPFLPLAVAATVTSTIKLGTNIATVFSDKLAYRS